MTVDQCVAFSNRIRKINKGEVDVQGEERECLKVDSDVNLHDRKPNNDWETEIDVNYHDVGLTSARRVSLAELKDEMIKGQMFVYLQGEPGSKEKVGARELEKVLGVKVLYAGATGSHSTERKSHAIVSLLKLGPSTNTFQERSNGLSIEDKTQIQKKIQHVRVLA